MRHTHLWFLAPLALGALALLHSSRRKKRARRQLVVALEMYAADHGAYPRSLALLVPRYLHALPEHLHDRVERSGRVRCPEASPPTPP